MIPKRREKCGWCNEQPLTFFEKHIIDKLPLWLFFKIVKIEIILDWPARKWHETFHKDAWDVIYEQWVKNLQPGDKVCTCTLKHETIKTIDLKRGELTTVEGNTHDIWHCIEPVDHDEAEHFQALEDWKNARGS